MKNKTILIIEDNDDIRDNIAEILELSAYNVIQANNGKTGVERAIQDKPDLILCDIMMPELDGFGVLRILNHNPETMDIPFLFLTAKTEREDFRKGMGLGADDYITKPFDDVQLLDAIELRLKKIDRLKSVTNSSKNDIKALQTLVNISRGNEHLKDLLEQKETRTYHKKETIYEASKNPLFLYFINSGLVKISEFNDIGKELISKLYKEGEFFGFENIILDKVYTDCAVAMEDTEVVLIPKSEFQNNLFQDRDISARMIQLLANNSREKSSQLMELAYSSVRKKVANALLELHQVQGNPISILREDLAALTGTAKETVIRTLSDFKFEKIIDITSSDIYIINKNKLEEMPV